MHRCPWVDLDKEDYIAYHDEEWGVPLHDDQQLFEFLTLESAQADLQTESDPLKRQQLIVQSRDAHAALATASKSVSDIGTALNVVVSFLGVLDKRLIAIDEKLNALQVSIDLDSYPGTLSNQHFAIQLRHR